MPSDVTVTSWNETLGGFGWPAFGWRLAVDLDLRMDLDPVNGLYGFADEDDAN